MLLDYISLYCEFLLGFWIVRHFGSEDLPYVARAVSVGFNPHPIPLLHVLLGSDLASWSIFDNYYSHLSLCYYGFFYSVLCMNHDYILCWILVPITLFCTVLPHSFHRTYTSTYPSFCTKIHLLHHRTTLLQSLYSLLQDTVRLALIQPYGLPGTTYGILNFSRTALFHTSNSGHAAWVVAMQHRQ